MRPGCSRGRGPGRWLGRTAGGGLAAVVVASGLGPAAAEAQERPVTTDSAADSLGVMPHPGLVVRALRAPTPLAGLPFSVTVREPAGRPPSAALGLADALRAVPGLQVQSRYSDALGDRVVVRGFGARAQFGIRGIHVLVDGIPATMPDGQTTLNHVDPGFLARAEVLRGPAAVAHGNAAGGVLLLTSVLPPEAGSRHELASTVGSDGLTSFRGGAAGAAAAVGWTASVAREWRDGYRPHSGTDRWRLQGRVDAPVAGGFLRVVSHGVHYDAENPGSLTPEQYESDPYQAQGFNVVQRTGEAGTHGQVGLTWERAFGPAYLEATGYALARDLENPIPPAIIALSRGAGGVRLLARGGENGRGGWAAGVDAAVQRDHRENFENDEGSRGVLTLDQRERVTNVAVHGQAMIPLLDRLGAFFGARYDRVSFSADDALVTPENPDDSGSRTMDAFSPAAGLRLDVTERASLYANVSTAFETPTTTELVNRPDGAGGFNEVLEPQRTISFEVGGRLGRGPLRLEASAYRARVRDALVPFEVESAPGRQYFRNAAGALHRGVEVSAELRTGRVDVLGAYARTDAEFTSYAVGEASYDGLTVPGVRPWTMELDVVARLMGTFAVEVGLEAVGDMFVDDANGVAAPGYELLDLRVAAPLATGSWTARLYGGVDNALDRTYVASVVPNAFGARFFEPGPGRTFFVGVEVGRSGDG